MSAIKLSRIAAQYGFGTDTLRAWLDDKRLTQADVARNCGTTPEAFALVLAQPEPTPVIVTAKHVD